MAGTPGATTAIDDLVDTYVNVCSLATSLESTFDDNKRVQIMIDLVDILVVKSPLWAKESKICNELFRELCSFFGKVFLLLYGCKVAFLSLLLISFFQLTLSNRRRFPRSLDR